MTKQLHCRISIFTRNVLVLTTLSSVLLASDSSSDDVSHVGSHSTAAPITTLSAIHTGPFFESELEPVFADSMAPLYLDIPPGKRQATPVTYASGVDLSQSQKGISLSPLKGRRKSSAWSDPGTASFIESTPGIMASAAELVQSDIFGEPITPLTAENLSHVSVRKMSMTPTVEARVLSIDGGGIKGLLVLEILALMEAKTKKHTTELFDMIGGTSAGALIATLMTIRNPETGNPKFSARTLKNALMEHYPNFFVSKWGSCYGLMKEKYKISPVRDILKILAGDAIFGDAIIPTFVTAFNVSGESKYHRLSILGSYTDNDKGKTVVDAALSSMSAPVFFKAHHSSDGNFYLDGGLLANNPSLMAYCQAKEYFTHSNRMVLLSIGAGSFDDLVDDRKVHHTGFIDVGPGLPDMFLQGQQSLTQDTLRHMPDVSDFRIDPILSGKKIELDDTSQESMSSLSLAALTWWGGNPDNIDEILGRIKRV